MKLIPAVDAGLRGADNTRSQGWWVPVLVRRCLEQCLRFGAAALGVLDVVFAILTKWFYRPVLKHGPRSLTYMRVSWVENSIRAMKVNA